MAMSSRRDVTFFAVLVLVLAMAMAMQARLGSSQPDCSGLKGSPELFITVNTGTPMDLMQHSVDDVGTGANDDVSLFKPKSGYWFGHTAINAYRDLVAGEPGYTVTYTGQVNSSMGSPIAPPVGWRRVWGLQNCGPYFVGFDNAYGMHCPVPPPGYVALGCIFRKTRCVRDLLSGSDVIQADSFSPPPASEVKDLVTLRADLAAPVFSTKPPAFRLWASYGSGANDQGTVHVLYPDTNAGCGVGLGLMLAQGHDFDTYDPTGFAVPDFTKVPPCCFFAPGPPG